MSTGKTLSQPSVISDQLSAESILKGTKKQPVKLIVPREKSIAIMCVTGCPKRLSSETAGSPKAYRFHPPVLSLPKQSLDTRWGVLRVSSTHEPENHARDRMLKRLFSKAAGEKKPEAYPLGYVEDFFDPRTKLRTFFSILSPPDQR
jgi:hypothetical protein